MKYSCHELAQLNQKPNVNNIDLDILAEFYQYYLIPFNYRFTTSNPNYKDISLFFNPENFCHLISLEKIVRGYSPRTSSTYKGMPGWQNVINRNITVRNLQQNNRRGFNSNKFKYVYFNFIPSLLSSPKAVLFDNSTLSTNVDCEILLYHDSITNKNLHLGIDYNEEKNIYVPSTFLITSVNDKGLINNQESIHLLEKKKVILL